MIKFPKDSASKLNQIEKDQFQFVSIEKKTFLQDRGKTEIKASSKMTALVWFFALFLSKS